MGRPIRYISLFSGIEAASVAWAPLGWEPVAFSEIEPFCCDLLAERFPDVPNLGDVSKVDWTKYEGSVDVVIGGSPCQAFSIAGQRKGLMDERGMLMLQYVRAVREIRPRWVIWENVPGVLSQDRGRAFGTLLGELEDCGYSLAWRVLDAQFYGVAQRRRRVFLVGHPVAGCAAAVLFEPESLRWDYPTSKEAREALAGAARQCAQEEGGAVGFCPGVSVTGSLTFCDEHAPTIRAQDSINTPAVAIRTANTSANGIGITCEVAHTLDTTGPEAVMQMDHGCKRCGLRFVGGPHETLPCGENECPRPKCFTQYGNEMAGTLTASHDSSPCADRGQNIVCMSDDTQNAAVDVDLSGTLKVGGGTPFVALRERRAK